VSPRDLKETLKKQPFQPFRIVVTDGASYDIVHPDFLLIGKRTVWLGTATHPGAEFPDRTIQIDLLHIIRTEPLDTGSGSKKNGKRKAG
jgi:hypothetical protein